MASGQIKLIFLNLITLFVRSERVLKKLSDILMAF